MMAASLNKTMSSLCDNICEILLISIASVRDTVKSKIPSLACAEDTRSMADNAATISFIMTQPKVILYTCYTTLLNNLHPVDNKYNLNRLSVKSEGWVLR